MTNSELLDLPVPKPTWTFQVVESYIPFLLILVFSNVCNQKNFKYPILYYHVNILQFEEFHENQPSLSIKQIDK